MGMGGAMMAMGGGMGNVGGPPPLGSGCVIIVSNLDEGVRFLSLAKFFCIFL